MRDVKARLVQCFQAVFPDLSDAEVERASTSRVAAWDSVATVVLASAVEEEFAVQLAPQEIEKLTSFDRFLNRLS